MSDWQRLLKADPTDWLLEPDNPSVRYFTLTDLSGKPESSLSVRKTSSEIMTTGVVPQILARQKPGGYWGVAEDFYVRAKYRGTVWQIIILAELGADGNDDRIKQAGEFILKMSQDRESGGFAYRGTAGGGWPSAVIPCLTGNMVWSLIRLGYLEDARVQRGIDWLVKYQRFDDAEGPAPKGWPYDKREPCWGKHTCHMGVVKTLKALAEIPEDKRTKPVKNTIQKGAEYVLKHHIHKRSHNLERVSKPGWLKFGFPLMANTDALEILGILTRLGYRDERMQEAIDLVVAKQDEQ
ncbi:MAG TPA: hypothetical protein VGA82_02460, partial [Dehalococcoidales bacterium]